MVETADEELVELLRRRREQLKSEAAKLDKDRAYLQAEYTRREGQLRERTERLEKELLHVEQILELRDGIKPNGRVPAVSRSGSRIENAAYELLVSERRGLHYKDILERLGNAGVPVPGSNPGATLVARLIRDGRFSRPKRRGVYALREWAPGARDVGARKKKGQRRGGTT